MVFVTLCALLFCGLSLGLLVAQRARNRPVASRYAAPPPDWPDIPIAALELFNPQGRINDPVPPRPRRRPLRFQTFKDTQSYVTSLVDPKRSNPPKIALQLSHDDGPDWTDVLLDGQVVAHVQTTALTRGSAAASAIEHSHS